MEEEEQKLNQEEKETRELMDYTVTLLALGYAAETAAIMAANREQRMLLLKEAGGRPLNAEQAAKWRELRESDRKAIEADWKNSQTEKYILHLAKCIDRERRRMLRSGTETEKAAAGMKLSGMENELRRMTAKLADKNVQKRMADYLRQQPQQAALRHLSPETMKQFGELLKKQGINISPVQEKKFETVDIRQENVGRDSLAQSLKNHFEQCRKTERILCEKYQHQNQTFSRASAKETAAFHSDLQIIVQADQIQLFTGTGSSLGYLQLLIGLKADTDTIHALGCNILRLIRSFRLGSQHKYAQPGNIHRLTFQQLFFQFLYKILYYTSDITDRQR